MEKKYRDPEARAAPYVWVTWLTKLLAGENHCEWALWFKSRHKYDKMESGFDLNRWTREHDEMVQWRATKLREEGHDVRVEDENGFRVEGKSGTTVAGKPAIVVSTDQSIYLRGLQDRKAARFRPRAGALVCAADKQVPQDTDGRHSDLYGRY